ncbi:ribokinase [Arthrobacter sp. M-10]|uniref:ribokinase n=1 Tax=Arthrobacter sp. M-10 TaxID=3233037 RepID=UPI003F8E4627
MSAEVVVVGSANLDYIIQLDAPPEPGQTVLAHHFHTQSGGKGANQAVAAARLGSSVRFIAAIGDDAEGAAMLSSLKAEGIDTSQVQILPGGRTGAAFVSVFPNGENSISVVAGANLGLSEVHVRESLNHVRRGAIVVVQAEVPVATIQETLDASQRAGLRCVLNLAPYVRIDERLLRHADPLVVNESEASALLSRPVFDEASSREAARQLGEIASSVVITMGAAGAYWLDKEDEGHVSAPAVGPVIDSTGAGDAFVGALAACLAVGRPLSESVQLGVAAGSFSVMRLGAQSSYPTAQGLGTHV